MNKELDCAKCLTSYTEGNNQDDKENINVPITLDKTLAVLRNMKSRIDSAKPPKSSNTPVDGADTSGELATETLKTLGTMMANSVRQQDKNQNRYHVKKRKYERQQRNGDQTHNLNRQNTQHSDGESQDYNGCLQDEYSILKKARSIIERMERKDGQKKVQFDEHSQGKRYETNRTKHDNKGYRFFQKPVLQSPRRT